MLELIRNPQTPFAALPFDQLKTDQFLPAFNQALQGAAAELQRIEEQRHPTFQSIVEALELSSIDLDILSSLFFNLYHACTDDNLDAAVGEISEKLADHSNNVQLSEKLFAQLEKVYAVRTQEKLNPDQLKLLEETYDSFVRNGARLNPSQKEALREIDRKLASLTPQFSQNILKATNAYALTLEDEKLVAALPASAREAAAEESQKRGLKGWTFTLQAPSYIAFMKSMPDRSLREKMWKAYNSKALSGEFSNRKLCGEVAKLRYERARLLGFKDHSDYVLKKRMAKTSENVWSFLEQLREPSLKAARKELKELESFAQGELKDKLQAWDFAYYSEKLKKKLFDLNDEDLRPYFPLPSVIEGVLKHGEKLYGLEFSPAQGVPTYHPEVQVFQVKRGSEFIGLLYLDLFPRDNKKSGAWMTNFIEQGFDGKAVRRPHVSIVCNFTRPTHSGPSLLTFNEVQTLFHEFGHALHSLCSHCYYRSQSGTNVLWDFVELPSQIMENWTYEKESLALFARHYQTGAPMPDDLFAKLRASRQFQAGYGSLRQLSFSLVDLSWHTDVSQKDLDPVHLEEAALRDVQLLPRIEGTNFSVSFSHIFAGGYSAGYYSYKWAEVLDADAFEAFLEEGIFNRKVADRFYTEILSRGGVEDPEDLFRRFRGRPPQISALLKRSGLV